MITLKHTILILFSACFLSFSFAQDEELPPISYEKYETILKDHVNVQGNVNYAKLKENKSDLDVFLNYAAQYIPTKEWTQEKEKAFWLNMYNAYVLKTIVDNYPVKSIKDVNGAFSNDIVKTADGTYSLDDVEKKLLKMKNFNVIYGICKGAYSSPKLSNIPFTEENVESRLSALATNFINDRAKNQVTSTSVKLNEVFKEQKKLLKKEGDLIEYLNQYAMRDIMEGADVEYMKFNWVLNK